MIDCEVKVFNQLYTALHASYPSANIKSEYTETETAFPCVQAWQIDNVVYRRSVDTIEDRARVTFQIDVYTKGSTRKADAKAIMALADTTMAGMQFTRIMLQPTPNIEREVYRLTARYQAFVGNETDLQIYKS